MDTGVIVVLVTTPLEGARDLAKALVEERLVACVNIIQPLQSLYWWEGKVQQDQEGLLIMKTRGELFESLRQRVVELHPYEVPEVLALPVQTGHEPYLAWVKESACRG